MKTLYNLRFLTILLISVSFAASDSNAQTNHYFQNDPVWRINSSCATPYPCIQNEDLIYFVSGDTVINDLEYVKVGRLGHGQYIWMDNPPNNGCEGSYDFEQDPEFFLRSENKMIYIRFSETEQEELLYDFNLEVGDTLPATYNNDWATITVSAVDSILMEGEYYKRFALEGGSGEYLIEGIGGTSGLISPMAVGLECGYALSCFSLNNNNYYPSVDADCDYSVGMEEETRPEITVFPNPMSSVTNITVNDVSGPFEVMVFDSFGREIKRIPSGNERSIQFYRQGLPAGMYMIGIARDGQLIQTNKLIISAH